MNIEDLEKIAMLMQKYSLTKIELHNDKIVKIVHEITIENQEVKIIKENNIEQEDNVYYFTSPMVGSIYLASSPSAEPFVSIGKKVKSGDNIFVIDSMKTFHTLTIDKSGIIEEILVSNGSPVEYGQKLLKIKYDT